jgi:hypothetical protein
LDPKTPKRATNSAIPVTAVIPYLDRKAHLQQALEAWFAQDYAGHCGVVVADFSDQPSPFDVKRVRLVRSQDTRWNISRAKNLGARNALGELLIFAHADMVVPTNFVSRIAIEWDLYDLWVSESALRGVPYEPTLDNLIAVKRWVNTGLRGYNEFMMESPHGWGYEAVDYRLRADVFVRSCGGSCGHFLTEDVQLLTHTDEDRYAPYEFKELQLSYDHHAAYSRWHRGAFGVEANIGQDWGQPW